MVSKLFTPIQLRGITLENRIVVSPMCQFSATEGSMTDWHLMHLGQFAVSGVGLVFVEATGVEPEGRITPGCTGLYSAANEDAMKRVVDFCRQHGAAKVGIQLAHAGRKASTYIPWQGNGTISMGEGGWQSVGPSAISFGPKHAVPQALDGTGLTRVKDAFVQATRRAERVGFDAIELHGAHGYLLHEFLSPLSNHREDDYGGTLERRMRFPLEVFEAMRAVWPADKPLGIRVSATDWIEGGWDLSQTQEFANRLKMLGCDFIDVSAGGLAPEQKMEIGPGYQTTFAAEVKRATGLTTMAVGLITDPHQAEHVIMSGQADMVALARKLMDDPHWAWHAASALGAEAAHAIQYRRKQQLATAGRAR